MRDATRSLPEISARVRERGCVVLLDFDGTLAPIVTKPNAARMSAATVRDLSRLARVHPVAIVTGRSLKDVRTRVRVRGVSFAGNHGLEWLLGGRVRTAPVPARVRREMQKAVARMRRVSRAYTGADLESKGATLSLHYRRVAPQRRAILRQEIEHIARGVKEVRLIHGLLVINILPAICRDKGTASRTMYKALARGKNPLPIFIGDDVTDEDAFRAFSRGITIRVGASKKSAARYFVRKRAQVDTILRALARVR